MCANEEEGICVRLFINRVTHRLGSQQITDFKCGQHPASWETLLETIIPWLKQLVTIFVQFFESIVLEQKGFPLNVYLLEWCFYLRSWKVF